MSDLVFKATHVGDVVKVTPLHGRTTATGYFMGAYGYARVIKKSAGFLTMVNGPHVFAIVAEECTDNLSLPTGHPARPVDNRTFS